MIQCDMIPYRAVQYNKFNLFYQNTTFKKTIKDRKYEVTNK